MGAREKRELLELQMISPYGMRAVDSRGREREEEPCDIRTCYQRDVDRITYSKAFRRLKHKTQVFLQPEGDHYRTRLTHTLEVSRIARTISRALELNEDLTEAVALGHDLGHTPFGHAGERALNEIYSEGFRHQEQSLRVVDRIENSGRGLNLTYETRMGILAHKTKETDVTLEAQAVQLSDRVAYINHDVDDAIRAGILSPEDLPAAVLEGVGRTHSTRINAIVADIISSSADEKLTMSPDMEGLVNKFRDFMFEAVYYNAKAKSEETKVLDILRGLWEYYVNHEDMLPDDYRNIAKEDGIERAVCDYISGMTDKYAIYQYGEIYIPAAWQVR